MNLRRINRISPPLLLIPDWNIWQSPTEVSLTSLKLSILNYYLVIINVWDGVAVDVHINLNEVWNLAQLLLEFYVLLFQTIGTISHDRSLQFKVIPVRVDINTWDLCYTRWTTLPGFLGQLHKFVEFERNVTDRRSVWWQGDLTSFPGSTCFSVCLRHVARSILDCNLCELGVPVWCSRSDSSGRATRVRWCERCW